MEYNVSISLGSVKRVTQSAVDAVNSFDNVNSAIVNLKTDTALPETKYGLPGFPNALEEFASYTSIFTLAVLTKEQYNNPFSYRSSDFGENQVIISSGGGYDDTKRVNTKFGTPEFFIDNVNIASSIAPTDKTGASNAISIDFEVFEPYSVGLFLQTLGVAAQRTQGTPNYLDAVFCLKIQFLGYKDNGQLYQGIQPKYFLLNLRQADMTISESGCTYAVKGVPYNHQGFSDIIKNITNDVSLVGSTVKELLATGDRSLQTYLNGKEEEQKANGFRGEVDIYEIHFPPTSFTPIPGIEPTGQVNRATTNQTNFRVVGSRPGNLNESNFQDNYIGLASFGFKIDSGGNYVSPTAEKTYDATTGKVDPARLKIDPKNRTFQYATGQSIIAIISQAIMASDYASKVLTDKPDTNGRLNWFRIDVQCQLLKYDPVRALFAKRFIYRVMPYKVHSSIFTNPNSAPTGYENLEKEIVKTYSYIYTGQNNDIIKLDLQLNLAFYNAIAPSPPHKAGRASNPDTSSSGEPETTQPTTESGNAGPQAQLSNVGTSSLKSDPKATTLYSGGSDNLTPEEIVANNFHQAFLANGDSDLINVDLEILGDPYWLTDNGIGGYIPPPGVSEMITQDGTANYEEGDIYIYIRFRSPIEPKEESGDYLFVDQKDSPYSGIYKVTNCENKFSGGTFTQVLKCVRMPRQSFDFDEPVKASKQQYSLYNVENVAKKPVSVFDVDFSDLNVKIPSNVSGIDRFINSLGDPNAPEYTGDDPIVRARLGLPPLTDDRDFR